MQKKFVKKLSIALGAICIAISPTMDAFAMEDYIPEHKLIPLSDGVPDFSITEIDFTNGVFGFMYNKANAQRRRLESFSVYSYDESSGVDLMTVEDTIKEQSFGKRYFYASRTLGTMPQETPITDELVLMKGTMFSNFWNENLGKKLAILVRFNDDSHWVSRISYGDCAWSYGLTCMPKIYWGLAEYGVYYQAYDVSEKLPQPDSSLEPELNPAPEVGSEADPEPEPEPEPGIEPGLEPEPGLDPDPDSDSNTEPGVELEPGLGAELGNEPEPDNEPGFEPGSSEESELGSDNEMESDNALGSGGELKPGVNLGLGAGAEVGSGGQQELEFETKPAESLNNMGSNSDSGGGIASAINNVTSVANNSVVANADNVGVKDNNVGTGATATGSVGISTTDTNVEANTNNGADVSDEESTNSENAGVDVEVPKLGGSEREFKDGLGWIWGISGFSAGVLITWFLFTVNKKKERRK